MIKNKSEEKQGEKPQHVTIFSQTYSVHYERPTPSLFFVTEVG